MHIKQVKNMPSSCHNSTVNVAQLSIYHQFIYTVYTLATPPLKKWVQIEPCTWCKKCMLATRTVKHPIPQISKPSEHLLNVKKHNSSTGTPFLVWDVETLHVKV
ncbi:hypothetical protein AMECASPLE_026330 [Ameca splendens]|uniref:Uncharacterized protein n=1 Tax=Ameca splendens TaxID=208324 RepID=A0ABV0XTS3_9TELE